MFSLTIISLDTHFKYNNTSWVSIEETDIVKLKRLVDDITSVKPIISTIILKSTISGSGFEQTCQTKMFNYVGYHQHIRITIYKATYTISLETNKYKPE